MGLVMIKVVLSNFHDVQAERQGAKSKDQVRSVELEALADTGAINLAIPADVAVTLGVPVIRRSRVRVADGRSIDVEVVWPLHVELMGREVTAEAIVLPAGARPLLGAVQLEMMDLVVVPKSGEVIPNPENPDGPVLRL